MTAPLKAIDGTADLPALMIDLAAQARAAARVLALTPPEQKDRALEAIERAIAASLVEGGPRTRDLGGNGDTKTVGAAIAELVKTV